jgi:2-polyprenyl-3-methyl-5-hydroxy-6-metoxy-1,4-benzoquinol methylase
MLAFAPTCGARCCREHEALMQSHRCCAGMRHVEVGTLRDDRYGYPGQFRAVRCVACGHAQLLDPPSEETQGALYSRFYPRSSFGPADYHAYRPPGRMRGWLEGAQAAAGAWVRPGSRVLEIGCGYGEMIGYLEKIGCEVQATELDENVAALARRRGFNIRIGAFDARNYPKDHFDYILLNQVLEHVLDPGDLLRQLRGVLASAGTVVISTPNGDGLLRRILGSRWIHWHAPYHVQLFTPRSLRSLAAATGFEARMVRALSPSSWLLYQWCHGVGYPEPGRPHPFWSERARKTLAQRVAYRALHLATHASRINHLLARGLDAAGVGDNLLALLVKAG